MYVHAVTNNYSLFNSASVNSLLFHIALHLVNSKKTLCTQEDSALVLKRTVYAVVQYCKMFCHVQKVINYEEPGFYDFIPFLCTSLHSALSGMESGASCAITEGPAH